MRKHIITLLVVLLLTASCGGSPKNAAVEEPMQAPEQEPLQGLVVEATEMPEPTLAPECELESSMKPEWSVAVCDTFDDNNNEWYTGEDISDLAIVNVDLEAGKYKIDVAGKAHSGYKAGVVQWFNVTDAKNFLISIDGEIESKNKGVSWGFNFWSGPDGFYSFGIGKEGWYYLNMLDGDDWFYPIKTKANSAIKWDETNNLTILVEEDQFKFYVNDKLVDYYESDSGFGEGISLFIQADEGANASYTFDNLLVKVP